MATRDENFKKINDELELMSDDKLDQVAGGTWEDIVEDVNRFKRDFGIDFASKYFNDDIDYYVRSDLIDAFRKFGIKLEFHSESANKYFIDGKEVTRDEAFNQVKNKLGR
ncbi:MAG: hypothetical protein IJQ85_10040 [Selenomonadaceae bacterium]|nr:hypothetical protein [Selenomonadaceae bacterium]